MNRRADSAVFASESLRHGFVVADNAARSDVRVGVALVHQQLSAVPRERFQVRIGGVNGAIVQLIGEGNVGIEVERTQSHFGSLKTTNLK